MPVDEEKALFDILGELNKNQQFKQQIYASVKKIIRLKICLGIV
jgi:beta-N-acetylhexosaminidase